MNILFLTSELSGIAKTGGLADVAKALPKELAREGHTTRVVMPYYSSINPALQPRIIGTFVLPTAPNAAGITYQVYELELAGFLEPGTDAPLLIVFERRVFFEVSAVGTFHDAVCHAVLDRSDLIIGEIIGKVSGKGEMAFVEFSLSCRLIRVFLFDVIDEEITVADDVEDISPHVFILHVKGIDDLRGPCKDRLHVVVWPSRTVELHLLCPRLYRHTDHETGDEQFICLLHELSLVAVG